VHELDEQVLLAGAAVTTPVGKDIDEILDRLEAGGRAEEHAHFEPFPDGLGHDGDGVSVLRVDGPDPATVPGVKHPMPDRLTLLAFATVDRALAEAGWSSARVDPARAGLIVNMCFGPNHTVERYLRGLAEKGPGAVSAITFARTVSNAVVGAVARRHELRGPSSLVVGASALGYAYDILRSGAAEAVVCLGIDVLTDYTAWMHQTDGQLEHGLVLGECGAAIVLERRESTRRRRVDAAIGMREYSTGFSRQAVQSVTGFGELTIERVARSAVGRAAIDGEEIAGVSLLSNGDQPLRLREEKAVRKLFPEASLLAPKQLLAETFGSSEVAAAACAASWLGRRSEWARVLVNAGQFGGAVSATVLERAA
jgi:3-oxoacyl-[acyl-carrier-protein] synthase II